MVQSGILTKSSATVRAEDEFWRDKGTFVDNDVFALSFYAENSILYRFNLDRLSLCGEAKVEC